MAEDSAAAPMQVAMIRDNILLAQQILSGLKALEMHPYSEMRLYIAEYALGPPRWVIWSLSRYGGTRSAWPKFA